jgi:hypothetical protein
MTRFFKAIKNIIRSENDDRITAGTYFSDEEPYNPNGEVEVIETGKRIPNVKAAPPPILFRKGYYAGVPEHVVQLLEGHVFEIVDESHADYELLKTHGVIPTPKPKKQVKSIKVKDKSDE